MPLDFALKQPTRYALADRVTMDRLLDEKELVLGAEVVGAILDALAGPVAIVNEFRQIVFANRRFLEFARCKMIEDVLGLRLGEVLGCTNGASSAAGCGTRPSCRACGAVNTVLAALTGVPKSAKVELEVEHNGRDEHVKFDLSALPLSVGARTFVLTRVDHPTWWV